MTWRVITGDCIEVMAEMAEASVDAIVTDPPYGLEFMGKEWDRLGDVGKSSHQGFADEPGFKGFRLASYSASSNVKCQRCGRWKWDHEGRKCECGPDAIWPNVAAHQGRLQQEWHHAWATEALRVLKPGGHLLSFGGTRTYHRLACALEDAGFEIRDCLAWMYGSGFPKSLDVSKAIDKAAGAEREVVGRRNTAAGLGGRNMMSSAYQQAEGYRPNGFREVESAVDITAPATPDAERWQGWGTALKPAYEPIVLARKPLQGTVAANVIAHGTGALNIDGTRIGMSDDEDRDKLRARSGGSGEKFPNVYQSGSMENDGSGWNISPAGRWPANVVLDDEAAALLDEQSGELPSQVTRFKVKGRSGGILGKEGADRDYVGGYNDTGGASRFYYTAKADRAERNRGLEHRGSEQVFGPGTLPGSLSKPMQNVHPTVKPIDLMQWLVRLVTPPGGTVLDPFLGSGTTVIAALREGFNAVGIEREPEYVEIARDRIIGDAPLLNVPGEVTE